MIDIAAVREAYTSFEISEVGLVKGSAYMADAFIKVESNGALEQLLFPGVDSTPVEHWITRYIIARFQEWWDCE